jgi:hypothetical protein
MINDSNDICVVNRYIKTLQDYTYDKPPHAPAPLLWTKVLPFCSAPYIPGSGYEIYSPQAD